MSMILQSIPCSFNEKITVFVREVNQNGYAVRELPPLTFDFPILINVGFSAVETKVVVLLDSSGSFDIGQVIGSIKRFALENESLMSGEFSYGTEEFSYGSSGSSGSSSGGSEVVVINGVSPFRSESFLSEIADRLTPTESRIIFLFQDESSPYGFSEINKARMDDDLEYLRAAYSTAAPSYVHIFAVGDYMISQLQYAWVRPPIKGSGWTWGTYRYDNDFFSLMANRLVSIQNNQRNIELAIPYNSFDLENILGQKPFGMKIWALDWEYLAELRADESNDLIRNEIIPLSSYSEFIFEYQASFPLTVTHLCGNTCCPPGCCMIRVRDQFCCVGSS